jgi:hypothetical protein
LRRALRLDAQIKVLRYDEHSVSIFETPCLNTINPNGKGFTESRARVGGRANEIGDHGAASFNDTITHPAHATRILDAVFIAEAEVAREIGAYGVRIEHHCVEQRCQRIRKRRLAGARQTHDQDFPIHVAPPTVTGEVVFQKLEPMQAFEGMCGEPQWASDRLVVYR